MKITYITLFLSLIVICSSTNSQEEEPWTGRWFPDKPTTNMPKLSLEDKQHGIKMGISSSFCDNAKTNLTIDWDMNPINYTCYEEYIKPDYDINPILENENIPPFYVAQHKCMNESIEYESNIPTFGTHRPLWPKYGEYKFVPKQRWIHNLEHGALVMLYHPCAHHLLINKLRNIVQGCLYRHIITPYNQLDRERPFALVTWGARITMSTINTSFIKDFIKNHALKGPEKLSKDGQYDFGLISHAKIVTTIDDVSLCPTTDFKNF